MHFYLANKDLPIKRIYTLIIEGKTQDKSSIFYPAILDDVIKPDKFLGLWIPSHHHWQRLEKSPIPLCNISFLSPNAKLILKLLTEVLIYKLQIFSILVRQHLQGKCANMPYSYIYGHLPINTFFNSLLLYLYKHGKSVYKKALI